MMPARAALVAVGGYGRGELFPYSDVDVLVLLPDDRRAEADAALKARSKRFITACWDIGLEIGSTVRTVDECVDEAPTRRDGADRAARDRASSAARGALFQRLRTSALRGRCDPQRLPARQDAGDAPAPQQVRRHALLAGAQLQGKPGRPARPAGGDLGGARRRASAAPGASWPRNGLVTPFEVKQLQRNEGLLRLIRARLHMIAGRREDRLVFDLQTAVAESFGYQPTHAASARPKC